MVTVPRAISIIVVAGAMPVVTCRRSLVDICRTHRVRSPRRDCYARGDGKCNNPRFHILMYSPPWSLKLPAACLISYLSCLDQDWRSGCDCRCWRSTPKGGASSHARCGDRRGTRSSSPSTGTGTGFHLSFPLSEGSRTIRPSEGQRWNNGDAEALGCSIKAVETRLRQVHKLLCQRLRELAGMPVNELFTVKKNLCCSNYLLTKP
jgi:hypothetical protein